MSFTSTFTSFLLCLLPISVYILSTSTSPRNNTSVSYFIVFICPISIPTRVKVVAVVAVVIPTASACISPPPSTSSLHRMLGAIPDPTPLYHLNPVLQLPPAFRYLLLSHVGDTIRLGCSTTQHTAATRPSFFQNFFFQYPFLHSDLFPPLVPLLYHICRLNLKITNPDSLSPYLFGRLPRQEREEKDVTQ